MTPKGYGLVLCLISILLFRGVAGDTILEPRTGISFPTDLNAVGSLTRLGVRTKGPIKVYAVAEYVDKKKTATFLLKMARHVGAERISSSLTEALRPRCVEQTCEKALAEFETLLLSGLPNGVSKGSELMFGTGGATLTVSINEKVSGYVSSKPLATAFARVYTDENAVCKMKPVQKEPQRGEMEEDNDEQEELYRKAAIAVGVVAATALLLWLMQRGGESSISISEVNVYPIKSCAALRLRSAKVTARGFEWDRIAQVTDKNGRYCTPRDNKKEKLFKVSVGHHGNTLFLTAPDMGQAFELDLAKAMTRNVKVEVLGAPEKLMLVDYGDAPAAWFEKATGIKGCRLTGIGNGFERNVLVNEDQGDAVPTKTAAPLSLADEAPYLLTSEESLYDLNRRLKARGKKAVDMRRFRPNIVVSGLKPWEEDSLRKIRIGTVEFWVWQRCGRCTMTTIDRDTLERGPEPLATLSTFRERAKGMRNFGMHLVPVEGLGSNSHISKGDEIVVLEYDEERRKEWERLFSNA